VATRTRLAVRLSLIGGILSPLLYVAMTVFIAMQSDGYSSASQTISELSAIDAATRSLWLPPAVLYTILVTAVGWGVWTSACRSRTIRVHAEPLHREPRNPRRVWCVDVRGCAETVGRSAHSMARRVGANQPRGVPPLGCRTGGYDLALPRCGGRDRSPASCSRMTVRGRASWCLPWRLQAACLTPARSTAANNRPPADAFSNAAIRCPRSWRTSSTVFAAGRSTDAPAHRTVARQRTQSRRGPHPRGSTTSTSRPPAALVRSRAPALPHPLARTV
jgi:hypothetical protein